MRLRRVLGHLLAAVAARHVLAADVLQDRADVLLAWAVRVDPEATTVARLQAQAAAPRWLRWLR